MKISAVILTKNSSLHIKKTLLSISKICDEIVIVDDFSNDNTIAIINLFKKVCVYKKKLNNNFSNQRNFGISKANFDWILNIDSDEYISEELIDNIKVIKNSNNFKNIADVFVCKRANKNFYGQYKTILSQRPILMRKEHSFQGCLHEFVSYKKSQFIKGDIIHESWIDLNYFVEDINRYSSWKALDWLRQGRRYNIYYLVFRQVLSFIYFFFKRYFFELRFIYGIKAFYYCLFWASEELLVGLKYIEYIENDEKFIKN